MIRFIAAMLGFDFDVEVMFVHLHSRSAWCPVNVHRHLVQLNLQPLFE